MRGVAVSPVDSVPRGATVLSSGRQSETPITLDEIGRVVALLSGQARATVGKILETGIKVIDVMCPFAAGATVGIAGDISAGIIVVAEEMVRRLSGGMEGISLFVFVRRTRQQIQSTMVGHWPRSGIRRVAVRGQLEPYKLSSCVRMASLGAKIASQPSRLWTRSSISHEGAQVPISTHLSMC